MRKYKLSSQHQFTLYRFKYIKFLQAQSFAVFEITNLGNFYSFHIFCKKSAKCILSKMCFMGISCNN